MISIQHYLHPPKRSIQVAWLHAKNCKLTREKGLTLSPKCRPVLSRSVAPALQSVAQLVGLTGEL